MPEMKLCSQCKVNPRADQAENATNPWCRECRARYAKEYSILRMDRKQREGFVRGREEMRNMIAREFMRLQVATFSGAEIARLVLQMPGPQVAEDSGEVGDSKSGAVGNVSLGAG